MFERSLGVSEWARRWKVHRNVARKALIRLRREHGPSVVRRRGRQGCYVMTETAFERLKRADGSSPVIQSELADLEDRVNRGLAELWSAIGDLRAAIGFAPKLGRTRTALG